MDASPSPSPSDDARAPLPNTSPGYAARIVLAAALVVAWAVPTPLSLPESEAPTRVATAAEQHAILIAIIERQQSSEASSIRGAHGTSRRLALSTATLSICGKRRQSQAPCHDLTPEWYDDPHRSRHSPDRPIDRNLSGKLVDALRRFNVAQSSLDTGLVPGIVAVDDQRIRAMYEALGYRREFRQVSPHVDGILRISRPVMPAGGNLALVYVDVTYDPSKIVGQMELFALRNGRWTFVGIVGLTRMEIN